MLAIGRAKSNSGPIRHPDSASGKKWMVPVKTPLRPATHWYPRPMKILALCPILVLLTACQSVGITDQGTLGRPALDFAATGPRSMECSLSGQLETGRSTASNVSAGGCSSCR